MIKYVYDPKQILGVAQTKKDLEFAFNGPTYQIIENIFKLVLMPNHSAVNHWRKEIASQIYMINKLKSTKKFPSADQIYSWSYAKQQDLVTDVDWTARLIDHLTYEYGAENNFEPSEIAEIVDNICTQYFSWLSDELSAHGIVSYKQIYAVLDSLL